MLRSFSGLIAFAAVALFAASANASKLDFSDYQGSESGGQASFWHHGSKVGVQAGPAGYDLTIGSKGLGVRCMDGRRECRGNDSWQLDASHQESVSITFDKKMVFKKLVLKNFSNGLFGVGGDEGAVEVGEVEIQIGGLSFQLFGNTEVVDLGGVMGDSILVRAVGQRWSDFSIKKLYYEKWNGPRPGPSVPEPTAALLFGVGAAVVASRRRR